MSHYNEMTKELRYGISVKKMNETYVINLCPHLSLAGVNIASKNDNQGERLIASISRSKQKILELAYCNPWEWFITITFDKNKVDDRYSVDDTMGMLRKWICTRNKAGANIKYLLVPELHHDGALHCHGLISGKINTIPFASYEKGEVPEKLRQSAYLNFPLLSRRFGWCSLGTINNREAVAYYMSKYITKHFGSTCKLLENNAHLYYCSQGLNRAEKVGIFHSNKIDADSGIPWDWKDTTTGQASLKVYSYNDVLKVLKGWEQIQ